MGFDFPPEHKATNRWRLNQHKAGNYIKVQLPKNGINIGPVVTVILKNGKKISEHLITGEGLASYQSAMIHFGIGAETSIKYIRLNF